MSSRCAVCGRWKLLDDFAGEGGAGEGYWRAGFCVDAVDKVAERLEKYPRHCEGQRIVKADALVYLHEHGREYAAVHTSPTCTGYSQGTVAIPDRLQRYDRQIAVVREILLDLDVVYVIENVYGARRELRSPIMLCGRQFDLTAVDDDGTELTLDRHRMFESNVLLMAPEHAPHGWKRNRAEGIQVAGSYGGARRNKHEAKHIRKGGYVPASVDVQRALLGTPWMSEVGCKLSVPPVFTEFIGTQLLAHIEREKVA